MEYNRSSIISDSAEKVFNEAEKFQMFLNEMDKDSEWIEAEKSKELTVTYAGSVEEVIEGITEETFNDTVTSGSKLILNYDGNEYYIGLSALPTLKARAGISGTSLEKLPREELAEVLNKCLPVSSGGTLIRVCGGKVRACHSKNYKPLSQSGIFRTARREVESYTSKQFVGGVWSHDYMLASWDIKDTEVVNAYTKMFDDAGIPINPNDIQTVISVSTSDVGTSGATVSYFIKFDRRCVVLGTGTKLNHKGEASLSEFADGLKGVFASYKKSFYELNDLANVEIKHPVGCIYNLLLRADLPTKLANETARRYNEEFGNGETDGLFLYVFGVSEILSLAKEKGATLSQQFTYQEKVARIIGYDFKKLDKEAEITDLK